MAKTKPKIKLADLESAKRAYASQYRKHIAALENKLANLKESIENGHSELAKGWLKELAQEANSLRREIEREL